MASFKKTMAAIQEGVIPPATICNRCGQTRGIVSYHNEDYSDPIKFLESLCWRCHMIHHSAGFAPDQCAEYWASVKNGKCWPPVFKHDFFILERDHGIVKAPGRK
jgi:hypothetical protein